MSKIYFHGLNELRAFAALGVVVHHIEQIKKFNSFTIANDNLSFLIHNLGKASVNLFFVLSGFLITYLLLQEKRNNNGHINILKFYYRRIFRIWPLYYFIMIISFVVIPLLSVFSIFEFNPSLLDSINNSDNYSVKTIALYLLFLPQFANEVVGASQSWSIGLEEQFYLLVPIALTIFNRKMFFTLVLLCTLLYFAVTIELDTCLPVSKLVSTGIKFLDYFNFQFLLVGVIGGYLYFYNKFRISTLTQSKFGYILLLLLIFFLSSFELFDNKLNHFILGILFLFLILFTINEANSLVFKNKTMSYLGKISYGIYMYHVFILFLIFPFANKYFIDNEGNATYYSLFLYTASFIATIVISVLSFECFESKFIKIKDSKYKTL